MFVLVAVVGLCHTRHRYLAASVEGRLRVAGAHLQRAECYYSAHFRRSSRAHHWLLWLLRSDHGEQMPAGDGKIETLLYSPVHVVSK